ncbi:MOSC domain-containing protein [Neptunomonas japonica]|uniref:MOSC domain-containing protein n=1 Tax=Neptunomonas japonica TaxID=417574 RepID=UPI0004177EB3|nr:MOSC domain-containing protein [Neptunomonas japonica]
MSVNTVGRLLSRHLKNIKPGSLDWIGLRPERKMDMQEVSQVEAIAEMGLAGDRRCNGTPGSARQVTLINSEHMEVVAKLMGFESIDACLLRRNLVVSGINLMALRHQRFRIGEVEFEATAQCHPCLRMEQALGQGGVAAMLGHGGICAKITQGGVIAVGDEVVKL